MEQIVDYVGYIWIAEPLINLVITHVDPKSKLINSDTENYTENKTELIKYQIVFIWC